MEIGRGAEAVITLENGIVKKWRLPKSYRQAELDERIRQERTLREARITSDARRHGVLTPIICDVSRFELKMEHVDGREAEGCHQPGDSPRRWGRWWEGCTRAESFMGT